MTTRLLIFVLILLWPSLAGAEIIGEARAFDGDRIEIKGQRIRIAGVDAPEPKQICQRGGKPWRCGEKAREALAAKINGRRLVCVETKRDRKAWVSATCSLDREDIGEWLLLNGWATAVYLYSYEYSRAEAAAKAERRGIWDSEFEMPWKWRRNRRVQP